MFRVKLSDCMRANPGLKPCHLVWVETSFGHRTMYPGEFLEKDTDDVIIKHPALYKLRGPFNTAEIELPISYLMEKETIRDKKIDDICQ
jgi:hypothetical protein